MPSMGKHMLIIATATLATAIGVIDQSRQRTSDNNMIVWNSTLPISRNDL